MDAKKDTGDELEYIDLDEASLTKDNKTDRRSALIMVRYALIVICIAVIIYEAYQIFMDRRANMIAGGFLGLAIVLWYLVK